MTAALAGVLGYFLAGAGGLLWPRAQRWLSVLALLGGIGALLAWAPGFPPALPGGGGWRITLAGDQVALGFWSLTFLLHGMLLLEEWRRGGPFHSLGMLLLGTTLALPISHDLFNLFVCLELTSLLSFLLVGYEARPGAIWASLKYLILTTVGMVLYLVGLGLVYGQLGTLSLTDIASLSPLLSRPSLAVGVGLLVAGAATKGGVFLFALWLPPAHGRAPHTVSALLSGLVVKMGIVTLYRLSTAFPVGHVLLALGVVTGVGGLVYALWERDLKLFLAYHTMSQLGYMLLGFGAGAIVGGLVYAVAHGMFKALLFLAAGKAIGEGGSREIAQLGGRVSHATCLALGLGTAAIVGLPPLAGYSAKEILASGLAGWEKWVLVSLGVGTAASFAKLIPLLGPGRRGGAWRGEWLLSLTLLGLAGWGFSYSPALSSGGAWGKALGAVSLGWLVHLGLRRFHPRLPRWTLDRACLAILVGAVAISLGIFFA